MDTTGVCTVGNLIDLSVDSNLSSVGSITPTYDNAEKDVCKENIKGEGEKNYGRLCGYLNKQGSRGILKTFRRKWFVFSQENCKLYYYRSPQDQVPLGEIDISKATFSFDITNKDKSGLFTISVPGKDYCLQAKNRQTCLFWLQELQKFRRANSLLRTERLRCNSQTNFSLVPQPTGGLLAINNLPANHWNDSDSLASQLIIPVEFPCDAIGNESYTNSNPISLAQQKFSNLKNQLRNRSQKSDSVGCDSNLSEEEVPHNSTFFDAPSVMASKEEIFPSPPSPNKAKSQGFSAIRSKITESFRKAINYEDDEQNAPNSRLSWRSGCGKCRGSVEKIDCLMDDITSLQDEITTSRALIKSLQTQLDMTLREKETLVQLNGLTTSAQTLELLSFKDLQIFTLSQDIEKQKKEIEKLQRHVITLETELSQINKENSLLQETVHRKDSTIVTLTNEVFELETVKHDDNLKVKTSQSLPVIEGRNYDSSTQEENDLDDLKIAVKAFEIQNQFLNKEVLELNQLRNDSEQRESTLIMKCSEWEARCCQIQSKLLFLLNELKKPDSSERSREIISRLLEEAMVDCDVDSSVNLPKWSIEEAYDDLGFNWKWGKEDLLSLRAENLKQRSEDITNKAKEEMEINAWRSKWENFLVSIGDKEFQRTFELKTLLRMGVPRELKGKVWKGCVDLIVRTDKTKLGPKYYNRLLNAKEFATRLDPSSKQIELDLLRTLPNNIHYENLDSDGIPKLRRVLLAYSRHDPLVGYCQGINRLAAIALLFMDEEDAFWCLVSIIKYLMPEDYFSRTLFASLVDQRVLKDLMFEKLPRVHSHLEQYNIDLSLFTFNWFLTVFVDNVPVEMYLRIWDVFLYEGSKVLFRFALTFFKYRENEILQLREYIALSRFLRNMAENMTDLKKICHIAFNELNPFPQKLIDTKRTQHMAVVKAQLDEFESIRNSLPRNSANVAPSEEDS